jgi:hypothetical protein
LPVATIIENLEDLSIDEVVEQFDVTREQVEAVLEFVAESLRSEVPTGAEAVGFDVLLTTDRRIRYQQNLKARRIALVVLTGSTKWSRVRQQTDRIGAAVSSATSGSYSEVEIPLEPRRGRT